MPTALNMFISPAGQKMLPDSLQALLSQNVTGWFKLNNAVSSRKHCLMITLEHPPFFSILNLHVGGGRLK